MNTQFSRSFLLRVGVTTAVGILFLVAAVNKLIAPETAEAALNSLDVGPATSKLIVSLATAVELYLGFALVLRKDLKFTLQCATGLMFVFVGFTFYLSTLAHPPSCGCLGLTRLFQSSRHEAFFALLRNVICIWALRAASGYYFPEDSSASKTTSAAAT